MTASPDFRSRLTPAFSPEQADAIVVVIAQSHENLATRADVRDVRDAVDSLRISRAARFEGGSAAKGQAATLGVRLLVDSWLQNL